MTERNCGFLRVAACCPSVKPADVEFNLDSIVSILMELEKEQVDVAVFPELCLSGYTCGDLFESSVLLDGVKSGIRKLEEISSHLKVAFAIGVPLERNGTLYNCALMFHCGKIVSVNGKRYIPNYNEFYERRWFEPWNEIAEIYKIKSVSIGVEICEDLWVPQSPSESMCLGGAEIILNLSASDDVVGKYDYLRNILKAQSGKNICGYVYASSGFGESSTDLVFNGKAIILENGKILAENSRWSIKPSYIISDIDIDVLNHDRRVSGYFNSSATNIKIAECQYDSVNNEIHNLKRAVETHPFVPQNLEERAQRCNEIIQIQSLGLVQRLKTTGCKNLVVGISGGLDSTLALLVACRAFDLLSISREGIHGITMPGFGTTARTESNAAKLCKSLGVSLENIGISNAVEQHFKEIGHDINVHDITYENAQARMRTLILMDLANKYSGMVLGTGDMSELALGWATYNGDHMSMYNVNAGVPKTLVRFLIQWFADEATDTLIKNTLEDIINTPISPELLPPSKDGTIAQKTENIVGPYELHDFFLYYTLRFGFPPKKILILAEVAFKEKFSTIEILKWMKVFFKRFFSQQFKRSCMPDGPKVGSVCLSPRGDWRMPSDASSSLWITQIDDLIKNLSS